MANDRCAYAPTPTYLSPHEKGGTEDGKALLAGKSSSMSSFFRKFASS